LLKKIVQIIASGVLSESTQTLSIVQSMTDLWNSNVNLKKEFAVNLKKSAKSIIDKELKDLMVKTSNELVPPPESKNKNIQLESQVGK
jgi:hypothetical protein